jgi:predicted enzyme related to lactoylglutathione lyase
MKALMNARLENINLLAANPTQLRDFYIAVFGVSERSTISHPPTFYMLDCGGCTLSIQDAAAVGQKVGFEGLELGFEVANVAEILAKARTSTGHIHKEEQAMGWGQAFTMQDPEGHYINVYSFAERQDQ